MKRIMLLICDGAADRVRGKTPLEAAEKPNMDRFATEAANGLLTALGPGIRPGSDTAHMALLGYDPFSFYPGRGPFEALGVGLELEPEDIAIRCNFATLERGVVIDRRAGRCEDGLDELAEALASIELKGVEVIFERCSGHRAVLVLRGPNLSAKVSDTDPEETGVPPPKPRPLEPSLEAKRTAKLLEEFLEKTHTILNEHKANEQRMRRGFPPANYILLRGAGKLGAFESFAEKFGLKRCVCVSATALVRGVCKAFGMETLIVEGATGHLDSNIGGKAKVALNSLRRADFVLLHIKGADEASHDGNFDAKRRMIERIDREVVSKVLDHYELFREEVVVAMTADHATPVCVRKHTGDFVPLAVLSEDVVADDVTSFSERSCARGFLGRLRGQELIRILLDLAGRAELFGA